MTVKTDELVALKILNIIMEVLNIQYKLKFYIIIQFVVKAR